MDGISSAHILGACQHYWSHFSPREAKEWRAESGFHIWDLQENCGFLILQSLPTAHIPLASHHSIWLPCQLMSFGEKELMEEIWPKFVPGEELLLKILEWKTYHFCAHREEKFFTKFCFQFSFFVHVCFCLLELPFSSFVKDWSFHNYCQKNWSFQFVLKTFFWFKNNTYSCRIWKEIYKSIWEVKN